MRAYILSRSFCHFFQFKKEQIRHFFPRKNIRRDLLSRAFSGRAERRQRHRDRDRDRERELAARERSAFVVVSFSFEGGLLLL